MLHPYETLFVLKADLPEAHVRETIERARRVVESFEGTVRETHEWGVRDLAYPIHKQSRGYYILLEYTSKPEAVWELERTLKIADEVLRFVSVRQETKQPKKKKSSRPSVPRESREINLEPDIEAMAEEFEEAQ